MKKKYSILLASVLTFSATRLIADWKEEQFRLTLLSILDGMTEKYPGLKPENGNLPVEFNKCHESGSDSKEYCNSLIQAFRCLYQNQEQYLSQQSRFTGFLENFRAALSGSFYRKNRWNSHLYAVGLAQDLALVYYTGTHIQEYLEQVVSTVLANGQGKSSQETELTEIIRDTSFTEKMTYLEKLQLIKVKLDSISPVQKGIIRGKNLLRETLADKIADNYHGGVTWASFDPSMQGNLPYLKYSLVRTDQTRPVQYVRMATPTINSNDKTEVSPEFKAYLDYLKNHKLSHTYINFQDGVKPSIRRIGNIKRLGQYLGIGNESHRSGALENLEKSDEYRGTFSIITLSRDSGFYRQARWADRKPAVASFFKKEFVVELFDGKNNGYHMPQRWSQDGRYRAEIKGILDFVHFMFFDARTNLRREERKMFIEISYGFIAEYAVSGSFSVNQTCKSGIDRAGSANSMSLLISLISMAQDENIPDDEFSKICDALIPMLFEDALIAKMREVKESRLKRFRRASLHMITHMIENPGLRKYFSEKAITRQAKIQYR